VIVDIDGEREPAPGRDRRRALTLAFAFCLAIGSAGVSRDGPAATTVEPLRMTMFSQDGTRVIDAPLNPDLSLPPNTTDVLLSAVPDRLANEAWPPLQFTQATIEW